VKRHKVERLRIIVSLFFFTGQKVCEEVKVQIEGKLK
jgi:hypothetical protein